MFPCVWLRIGAFFMELFCRSCHQRQRKHLHLRSLLRLCGQQAGSASNPLCAELCLDTIVNKNQSNQRVKTVAGEFVYVPFVTQCFPQLLLWAQAGFSLAGSQQRKHPFPMQT